MELKCDSKYDSKKAKFNLCGMLIVLNLNEITISNDTWNWIKANHVNNEC